VGGRRFIPPERGAKLKFMTDRRALFDAEGRALLRYARALTQDDDRARDLWQETAARVLAARTVPAEARAARVWLFRILRNAFIDDRRRQRPAGAVELAEAAGAAVFGHDARLIAEMTVRQALERLPEEQRELVGLVDIVGFSYADAAESLGLPIGTVMSRLARARAAMLADIANGTVVPLRRRQAR